jgi:hypothetical protein
VGKLLAKTAGRAGNQGHAARQVNRVTHAKCSFGA